MAFDAILESDVDDALHRASGEGQLTLLDYLLIFRAEVNSQSTSYGNALYAASRKGQVAVVELLLQNGADINAQSTSYGNALYAASENGRVAVVELLLQNGADINAQNAFCESALYAASRKGQVAVVELLLQNGADINAQSTSYGNALYAASENGRVAVVELLLQNGADINAQNAFCESALYAASRKGQVAVVELLLQNGADVNAQSTFYGNALQVASWEGRLAVVELLLQNGADVNARDEILGDPLYIASDRRDHRLVELLLQYGAKFNSNGGFSNSKLWAVVEPYERPQEQWGISAAGKRARASRLEKEMAIYAARERARTTRLEKEMAISSAALLDDWKNVRRLVTEGCDPNCGKSFMERPLFVAIMHANLKEAEFLLRNYAIRDLGDQFYPLRDAILRQNVQEAQAVLSRPRSLKPPKVETKRQTLQRHFHEAHKIFLVGGQSTGVGQEYKELATEMDSHKRMWRTGMAGVRRLIKNRSPQNLQQVIGMLCVASAMRKSLQSEDTFGNHDLFLEDLDRWRELAIRPQQRTGFDEIVFAIWGKRQNSTETPDTLDVQEEDRYILFESIRNMVQRFATESSLPLTQLEHENFWEYYESSEETSVALYESRNSHIDNSESPNDPRIGSLPDLPATREENPSGDDSAEGLDWDPGLQCLVPALLMMGAIFACVIHFLFALHSGYVFPASSYSLSTQLNTSYRKFVFQVLTALPAAGMWSDLRSATTSTLITLEGWAVIDRCELMKLFLSHADGWVPLKPPSFTGESFDPSIFDSESNSMSATTPTPSTLSSSSTSTSSRHRCRICGEVLSSMGNLNRHLKRHQNSEKHSCQNTQLGCCYSDIRKDNVEKHEIKHCRWRRHVLTQNSHR